MTSFLENGQLIGLYASSGLSKVTIALGIVSMCVVVCAELEDGNSDECFSTRVGSDMNGSIKPVNASCCLGERERHHRGFI